MTIARCILAAEILLSILLPISIYQTAWSAEKRSETIRLLIGSFTNSFSVTGNRISLTCLDTRPQTVYQTENTLTIKLKKYGIATQHRHFSGSCFMLQSKDCALKINDAWYGGAIIIDCSRGKEMMLINVIDLEQYLEGLISIELSPRWEFAAMKAQAVVARTYALCQKAGGKNGPYHLTTSVLHQLYRGIEHANGKTKQAVRETRGEVLTYGGEPIMAVYHSCCGGRTEDAENVWESDRSWPYLKSVFCGACVPYEKYFWKLTVPRGTFFRKLSQAGYAEHRDTETCTITKRSSTNRVLEVSIQGNGPDRLLSSNEFRSLLGYSEMRSTNFIIRETDDGYLQFLGIGNGHGVGLCQWGARNRALRGETYRSILLHYYPGAKLEKWY